jgi:hypothetical protein
MLIDLSKAVLAFQKLEAVRNDYRTYVLAGDSPQIRIEDLYAVVGNMYGIEIVKTSVPFDATHTRGMFERWKSRVNVRIRRDQPMDWLRFAAVKELFHLINDETEDFQPDGTITIIGIVAEYTVISSGLPHPSIQSEDLAEICALEFMYPYEYREADMAAIKAGNTTVSKIALHYGVPSTLISKAVTPYYHTHVAGRIWGKVRKG